MWALAIAGFLVSMAYLRALPYSTSWLVAVDEKVATAPPSASGFALGPLEWDLETYRGATMLEPFRVAFASCSSLLGLDAARCATNIIQSRSSAGSPTTEFVDAQYDPAEALHAHLSGAPGHCTARSSMLATALLSMGLAARVVQVLSPSGVGHNLVEVWDSRHGWLLFDPHFDSSYLLDGEFVSAAQLTHASRGLTWRRPHEGQPDLNVFAGAMVSYPEPWLYTRVGGHCAPFPFRGCFAQIAPKQWEHGMAQHFSRAAALVFLALPLLWLMAQRLRVSASRGA